MARALGLLAYAWALRRVLREKPSRASSLGLVIMVVIPDADVVVAACGLGWPAAAVGISWVSVWSGRNRSWIGRIRYRMGFAGDPTLRLMALAETGTRGLLGATIGSAAERDETRPSETAWQFRL